MNKRIKISFALFIFFCISLFLVSCANSGSNYPFAGDWQGSGSDSAGNDYTFAAKVIDLGDGKFRMLVLDKLGTKKKPMHTMDGVLENNKFPHTADNGIYTGSGELTKEEFTGWYKGPVDGTYKMQRVK
ncbi:MAG: hypothetical protein FVQ82_09880 [Planctomycetes bacterium]|nr:hypothetical protein [Planctomycetota bacterium]